MLKRLPNPDTLQHSYFKTRQTETYTMINTPDVQEL